MAAVRPGSSTCGPPPSWSGSDATSCCTPAPRWTGAQPPAPCAGRSSRRLPLRGLGDTPDAAERIAESGPSSCRPATCQRRSHGRHREPLDADVGARGGRRAHQPEHAQRRPGQGVALRRLRRQRDGATALDGAGARPDPGFAATPRPHRRRLTDRLDGGHGRRGPQPQPGGHVAAGAGPGTRPRAHHRTTGNQAGDVADVLAFIDANDHFLLNPSWAPPSWSPTPGRVSPAPASSWPWPATARTSASGSPAPASAGSPPRGGARRALPGRIRSRRRQRRHRRLGDHRDRGAGRVRHGGGTRHRATGGGRRRRRPGLDGADVRGDAGRAPDLDASGRGLPASFGIDVLRVVRTGVVPIINTGIAGRVAGTGQVGAGLVRPPLECFWPWPAWPSRPGRASDEAPAVRLPPPTSVEEATRLLAELETRRRSSPVARAWCRCSTSAWRPPPTLSTSTASPASDGLDRADGAVDVGATVRHSRLLREREVAAAHPLLVEATGWIAHPVIHNRGTVCGSLAHADPAAELPRCWRCWAAASRRWRGAAGP